MADDSRPPPSVALNADGSFDESRLAKPSDWAALDDFDEEAIIKEMTSRVEETFLAAKEEVQLEKLLSGAKDAVSPAATAPTCAPSRSAAVSAVPQGKGCAVCGVEVAKLKRCTACKAVSYCSRECQSADWPQHKLKCKQMQQAAEEDLTSLD